jgi:hypothetical protein
MNEGNQRAKKKRHMTLFVIMNEGNQRATAKSTWHCLYRNRDIICHGRAMCLLIDPI